MQILPIKTRIMFPPKDDLWAVLHESLPELRERDVVVVTSKIVSIGEGRSVPIGTPKEKQQLVQDEADYLARFPKNCRTVFSVKGHAIVGSAGIDESNSNGYWTLWPKDPFKSAKEIWTYLRKKHNITRLGIIITDSVSPPMRLGCIGTSIGFFGLHPLLRYIGKSDLFGRKFLFERSNLVDGIAAGAVAAMGEGDEQTPLALVRDIPSLRFVPYDTSRELLIHPKEDIYYPLFKPLYESKKSKTKIHSARRRKS
ncbi:MAG: coenzyme F420-0:L-glutamate ligase [bacterium]|nr:coenzyme F420-0:L-glutamate ligase [bacterium]